ncbi:hypothetical protein [Streptomyces mirabilis]|uniref:hypothetical protein n=1 Tax=Streptomyces mirabilis TaxID=68239 RepID=UPI00368BEF60
MPRAYRGGGTGPLPEHEAGRRRLGSRLTKNIKSCAASIEKADPETEATAKDYSTLPVEESTQVHSLHTVISWGASTSDCFPSALRRLVRQDRHGREQAPLTA